MPTTHTLRGDETLAKVAERYGISRDRLARFNGTRAEQVRQGDRVLIPSPAELDAFESASSRAASKVSLEGGDRAQGTTPLPTLRPAALFSTAASRAASVSAPIRALNQRTGEPVRFAAGLYESQLKATLFKQLSQVAATLLGAQTATANPTEGLAGLCRLLEAGGRLEAALDEVLPSLPKPTAALLTQLKQAPERAALAAELDGLTVVLTPKGEGKTIVSGTELTVRVGSLSHATAVSDTLAAELTAASSVRRGVMLMMGAAGKPRFAHQYVATLSDEFFDAQPGGEWSLKPKASASEALDDLIESSEAIGFESATAMTVARHLAAYVDFHDRYGEKARERFDQAFSRMILGPQSSTARLKVEPGQSFDPTIGAFQYFDNPGVDAVGYGRGRVTESVVLYGYAGPKSTLPYSPLYFGHPFGLATAQEIVASLERERRPVSADETTKKDLSLLAERLAPEHAVYQKDLEGLVERLEKGLNLRRAFRKSVDEATEGLDHQEWLLANTAGDTPAHLEKRRRLEVELERRKRDLCAEDAAIDAFDRVTLGQTDLLRRAVEAELRARAAPTPLLTALLEGLARLSSAPVVLRGAQTRLVLPV